MSEAATERVRSFNRVVVQAVGALHDHYLSRDLPLGEARVLWEIGPAGCDVRALRARLALASGYLSRLLRSLEAAGLVTVAATVEDGRVRRATLTRSGRRERDLLDRGSDELAQAFLEPLRDRDGERLVEAMGEVDRLLTAGLVRMDIVDPESPAAEQC